MRIIEDIELKQINLFDERWYSIRLDGVDYDFPSVTTYLEAYPKGFGYDRWLMETKDPYKIRDEAGQIGTDVHKLIENALKGITVKYSGNLDVWERFMSWVNWFTEFRENNEVHWQREDIEKIVFSLEYRYAGTADFIPVVNGIKTVIDWKTGSFVGDSAEMQLSAYAKALGVERALIVQINPKLNKKGFKEIEVKDIEGNFNDFLNVKKIWERVHKNEKPKYKYYPTEININQLSEV